MIRNISNRETALVWSGEKSRKLPSDIQPIARRKLRQLAAAERLGELATPRGNRLEQLHGFAPSRYSVRVNDQWRITFCWSDGGANDVQIEDYHRG